jgi:hypothetical protein
MGNDQSGNFGFGPIMIMGKLFYATLSGLKNVYGL